MRVTFFDPDEPTRSNFRKGQLFESLARLYPIDGGATAGFFFGGGAGASAS